MSEISSELQELLDYLKKAEDFDLPSYKELPSIELYMDQLLKYVNRALEDVNVEEKAILTSFMVNNYVKAKMIPEPIKKKYSKDQIGYLIAISMMKSTMTMSDMAMLLEFESRVSEDKNKLYTFWSDLERDVLAGKAEEVAKKVEKIQSLREKDKVNHLERADQTALDQLAFLALRLSIEAQANKLLSQAIIGTIRGIVHGEVAKDESIPTKAELKSQDIAEEKIAARLSQNKQKRQKQLDQSKKKNIKPKPENKN